MHTITISVTDDSLFEGSYLQDLIDSQPEGADVVCLNRIPTITCSGKPCDSIRFSKSFTGSNYLEDKTYGWYICSICGLPAGNNGTINYSGRGSFGYNLLQRYLDD